jgi:amino acid transporter
VAGASVAPQLQRELGLRDLVLFSFAGVASTRGAAMAAQMGAAAVPLWILGTALFFIPSAFAIGRLSQRYPRTGGLYIWTRECFGEWHGFLCFWNYWLGLAFLFTSALMASASMTVYAFGSRWIHLAESPTYVLALSLVALSASIGANVLGLRFGKWLDNAGAICTYVLCGAMAATAVLVWLKQGSATPFRWTPAFDWQRVTFFSQIAFALTGLELAPILAGEIKRPERNLPLSGAIVAPLAATYYIIETVSILVIVPADQVSPLHGIAQSAYAAGQVAGFRWIAPVTAVLLFAASIGQLSVFGASAARLPYAVGVAGLLPEPLTRIHPRWHTPHVSTLLFGALAAGFLLLVQAGETLRATFQIMIDMMTIGGLIPFVYIFAAGWKCGAKWSGASGIAVTIVALACAVLPSAEVRSVLRFEVKLAVLTGALIISARILYNRSRRFRP